MKVVEQFKKRILDLAIRGRLVPQDPSDEQASVLLERIKVVKAELVRAKKMKKEKNPSEIIIGSDGVPYEKFQDGTKKDLSEDVPFDLPKGWAWARLGSISNYGQCTSVDAANANPSTWSLDLEEIEKGTGRLVERKTVAEKESKSSKHVFAKGMLLYSKLRTYLNKVLVADMDGVCTSEIMPVQMHGGVSAEYVRLVLMSPYFLEYTASKGYGVKMPRIGTNDMREAFIPLPPLAEQKRIAAKVEELFALTRGLKERFQA